MRFFEGGRNRAGHAVRQKTDLLGQITPVTAGSFGADLFGAKIFDGGAVRRMDVLRTSHW
jgi:hypothetical protein